jgi:hypothetical protein
MGCHLRLPTSTMDAGELVLQLGSRNQNVCSSCFASGRSYYFPKQRRTSRYQAGVANGTGANPSCISVLTHKRNGLPPKSLRVLEAVLVQMDSQLEIPRRGDVPKSGVFDCVTDRACERSYGFHHNTMVKACRTVGYRNGFQGTKIRGASGENARRDINSAIARLYPDDHLNSQCHWNAFRAITPLPVLRLYCAGNSFSALAQRITSGYAVCLMGSPRMGLECLSQHQPQLDGRRRCLVHNCDQFMGRYAQGFRRSQG